MNTSESIDEFATAMCKAQAEMGGAVKGSANPFFKSKFADLGSVMEAIRSPFAAHGLCFVQGTSYEGGCVSVTTRLMHVSGQWVESSLSVPLVKQDPQGVGSAISYAKRYSLQSLCGIPSVDDDGETAHGRQTQAPAVISAEQAVQVGEAIKSLGMDLPAIRGYYKIKSLTEMTPVQFDHISGQIKKNKSEAAA